MLRFAAAEASGANVFSALTRIEARSVICRLRKGGRLSPDSASRALSSIASELDRMIEQPINHAVQNLAAVLVERHSIRSLDAIQLGSAIVARDLAAASEMRFIASDMTLLEAARKEGFEIWNPVS
jgi:hypothetical protein